MDVVWFSFRLVILGEPLPHVCCTQANHGIFARFISCLTAKYFGTDHPLSQQVFLPSQSVLNDISEQTATLLRISKRVAGQDLV